ncbi:MAG: GNAT family N-acetyltransferase, partial [Chloroflexota bacterium]|nr:GNAT family N-acetyltransferase [Chloroflexota bacterium]
MTETTTASPSARGDAGQTFLVGDTLYLRGLETDDASRATAWRASPFPIPVERAETILKEEIPSQAERWVTTLVACRRADDEPVGAATMHLEGWRIATVLLHADPALGSASDTKAEILRLVVPWLSDERHLMAVWAELDDEVPVVAAAEAIGMRPAYRLREALWRGGRRQDKVCYELLHPAWLE